MAQYGSMFDRRRLDLKKEIPLPAPLIIQLEASGFCNLRCVFCPVNDKRVERYFHKELLEPALFSEFIRQCEKFPRPIKVLRFIGNGEPLMNKHIAENVKAAKRSGAFERVEITSNGTLLTDGLSDSLIAAGLDVMKISLEATDDETFSRIGGVRINVGELYEKLRYFYQRRGNCKLYIKTTDVAVKDEENRSRFLEECGRISDYIFVESVTDIWPEYTSGLARKPRYGRAPQAERPVCIQPFYLMSVTAGGMAGPCCADWQQKLSLGNIKETSLMAMWRGEKLRAVRLGLLEHRMGLPCECCGFPSVSQSDFIDGCECEIIERLKDNKEGEVHD